MLAAVNTTQKTDPIRKLLAGLAPAMFLGNPPGTVAIWQTKVIESGGDPDAVLAWVREQGGYRDKSFPPANRRGRALRDHEDTRRYYVIPESALS
jgi:hypothetical protein